MMMCVCVREGQRHKHHTHTALSVSRTSHLDSSTQLDNTQQAPTRRVLHAARRANNSSHSEKHISVLTLSTPSRSRGEGSRGEEIEEAATITRPIDVDARHRHAEQSLHVEHPCARTPNRECRPLAPLRNFAHRVAKAKPTHEPG